MLFVMVFGAPTLKASSVSRTFKRRATCFVLLAGFYNTNDVHYSSNFAKNNYIIIIVILPIIMWP